MTSASLGAPFQYSYHFFIFIFYFFFCHTFSLSQVTRKIFLFLFFIFLSLTCSGFRFYSIKSPSLLCFSLPRSKLYCTQGAIEISGCCRDDLFWVRFVFFFFFSFFLLYFGALCVLVYVLSGCWEILGEEMNSLWRFCGWIGCCRILRIIIFFLIFFFFFGQFLGI